MIADNTIFLALLTPLIGAMAILFTGRNANLRETVTIVTSILTFLMVVILFDKVANGERPSITVLEMLPGLGVTFTLEPLGMLFAAIASGLWIITSVYAIGYMRGHHEINQTRFYVCFAIAIFSALGIAFAGNMLTLFVFYEVLTLCTFPLVTHSGTESAKRAGRVYLGILIGTSVGLQLIAMIWTWNLSGTLDFRNNGILPQSVSGGLTAVLIGLYVYGIGKAALMPFHRWLPAAMVAPTPVSALLHAVAVVKAGVFTVLKVTIYIFGFDVLSNTGASEWLAFIAAATILVASIVAMTKDNLKARLAYSTVSQLSYIVLGAMLASGVGAVGGAMHIAMHAFGKITLFFCAGAIMVAGHKTEISQMQGLGRKMPITFACFLIGALSIIGLPPLGGVWSKWHLSLAAAETGQLVFIAVFMISSLLNIAYLLPIVINGFFFPLPEKPHNHNDSPGHAAGGSGDADGPNQWRVRDLEEAPLMCLVALTFTAMGCIVLFFYATPLYEFL